MVAEHWDSKLAHLDVLEIILYQKGVCETILALLALYRWYL